MPANPKYLTTSRGQKIAKLSAGLLGGYMISALLHMILSLWMPFHYEVLITSTFTIFIVWVVLMVIPYLFKNGWKAWVLYLILVAVLCGLYYWANHNNPFVS